MFSKINSYFEVLRERYFKMQVILLNHHLFPSSWGRGWGRGQQEIQNIPYLQTSLPSYPWWQTKSFLRSYLRPLSSLITHHHPSIFSTSPEASERSGPPPAVLVLLSKIKAHPFLHDQHSAIPSPSAKLSLEDWTPEFCVPGLFCSLPFGWVPCWKGGWKSNHSLPTHCHNK